MESKYNDNNPTKNNLFNIMKYIASTYYYMDKFERRDNEKFIENKTELTDIGKEMFQMFGLDTFDIKFFVDICAAPGMYSKIIFDDHGSQAQPTGIGISLPPEKGGVKFEFNHNNYKQFYKDILEKQYKLELPKKLDFGMASCVSYINDSKRSHQLNMELIITSLNMIMNNLMIDGSLIINMSMKNIYTCYNILSILLEHFKRINLWKSSKICGTKNTFYIFCYDFKTNNYDNNMIKYINMIKDNNSEINNKFMGTREQYREISLLMETIYTVRINCWLDKVKYIS
jgi:hypothetical protein